jgi:hypothetical protein
VSLFLYDGCCGGVVAMNARVLLVLMFVLIGVIAMG